MLKNYFNKRKILEILISQAKIGDWKNLFNNANKLISIDPENRYGYFYRAAAKSFLNDLAGALEDYGIAIELYPKFGNAYYLRARIKCDDFGLNKSAIEDFTKAIEFKCDFIADSYFYRGEAKAELGDYSGAELDYTISGKMGNEEASNRIQEVKGKKSTKQEIIGINQSIATINMASGKYKQAIRYYTLTLEIDPQNSDAYCRRGNEKVRLNDFLGAFQDFEKSIEINPKNGDTYFYMGRASCDQGKLENAKVYYKKALEINPDFNNAKEALQKIEQKRN